MAAIRVCVIGAGAAGLAALRHLVHRSHLFQAVAYEQSSAVGGTWVYTDMIEENNNGVPIHSSMYKNLKTNLPKEVMAFPDFPFSDTPPSYIYHHDVLKYLEEYANHFDVKKYIQFNTSVKEVTPKVCAVTNKPKWTVEVENEHGEKDVQEFDAVMVCTGHYSSPIVPDIPGLDTFKGKYLHSHSYRNPEMFRDQVVICLGANSSGTDIALDLSAFAKKIYLSHRKEKLQSKLPDNIEQVRGIASVSGKIINLEDGSQVTIDTLIFCTGYNYTYPFLKKNNLIQVSKDERVTPLYHHLISTEHSTLSFIGIPKVICPFPLYDCQVRFVLAMLTGTLTLPSKDDMNLSIKKDYTERLASGMPPRYSHHMGPRQWGYNDMLAEEAGFKKIPSVVQRLYEAVFVERATKLAEYKTMNYRLIDENSFEKL